MKTQRGLSYVELMVTMGLMGLLYLASMHIVQQLTKLKRKSQGEMAKGTEIIEIRKMLSSLKDGLSWQTFDFNESYYLNRTVPLKVNWSLGDLSGISSLDQLQFEVGGNKFLRNSHSLEVVDLKNGPSAIFSRCLLRADEDKVLSIQEAYALPLVPYLVLKGGVADVFCCNRGINNVCPTSVDHNNSTHTIRTFFVKNQKLKTYPLKADSKALDGMGLFFLFDKSRDPNSYQLFLISQLDQCYVKQKGKNCGLEFSTKYLKLTGNIRSQGIHDSGFMEIN